MKGKKKGQVLVFFSSISAAFF